MWYTIQTHSNSEHKVARFINATKKNHALANTAIEEVLVPEESFFVYKGRERKVSRRRMFANYVFLRGNITDAKGEILPDLWTYFGSVPGMRGFMGGATPQPMKPEEAESLLTRAKEVIADKYTFTVGETVKVKDGPFISMSARVKAFNADENQIDVEVEIFGRLTSVSLTPNQVERSK